MGAPEPTVCVVAVAVAFRSPESATAFAVAAVAAAQAFEEKPMALETKSVTVTDSGLARMLVASLQPQSGVN